MNIVNPPESVKQLTRLFDADRFADGRPRVSDDLIERMKLVTTEEAWSVLRRNGYSFQFVGGWLRTHPDQVLVGRVVTAQMVPQRPDLQELVQELGEAEGRIGGQNSWVIDTLEANDVMVVDMFGKVYEGTFVGDNLATSVRTRTRAGAVINGGIRDFAGIAQLTDVTFFHRGLDPSAIKDCTLAGINIPIRIDGVTVLPGDIVLGTPTGVIFIPAHLAQEVVERSEDVRVRDEFGKLRLTQKRYTPGEIDRKWSDEIEADFQGWLKER
ncbi:MAG: RraA family protein [Caldilineaceae bacterium]|nr:RraA family protein [Caldilineaceae bacterium]